MSAFNTVSVQRLTPCERCGDATEIGLQYAYGDTWQYHYKLGDYIQWGGNDRGTPSDEIEFVAYPEDCPICGLLSVKDYVITIRKNQIVAYRLALPDDIPRLETLE